MNERTEWNGVELKGKTRRVSRRQRDAASVATGVVVHHAVCASVRM